MAVKFFKCMHCGNVAIKVLDQGVPDVLLRRGHGRAYGEQHRRCVREARAAGCGRWCERARAGGRGRPSHDQSRTSSPWWFWSRKRAGAPVFAPLTPADAPEANFTVAAGDKPVKVYEYCNLHGLWVEEILDLGRNMREKRTRSGYAAGPFSSRRAHPPDALFPVSSPPCQKEYHEERIQEASLPRRSSCRAGAHVRAEACSAPHTRSAVRKRMCCARSSFRIAAAASCWELSCSAGCMRSAPQRPRPVREPSGIRVRAFVRRGAAVAYGVPGDVAFA